MKLRHIPNILSIFRLVLVAVFVFVYFWLDPVYSSHVALCVFVLAGITDIIDGHLARKYNWISETGKILDPLADKLMQCTVLVCLMISRMIPVWYAVPFIGKELLILFLGFLVMKRRNFVVVSDIWGKLAAFVFYGVIGLVMLVGKQLGPTVINIMCAVSLALTIIALVLYTLRFFVKQNYVHEKTSAQ